MNPDYKARAKGKPTMDIKERIMQNIKINQQKD
jgi:hypothetical protein